MVCESSKKLDAYLDGELVEEEMPAIDGHVRSCLSCSTEALARTQLKRAVKVAAGGAFAPSAEIRERIQESIGSKRRPGFGLSRLSWGWLLTSAAAILVAYSVITSIYVGSRSGSEHIFSEVADLHV